MARQLAQDLEHAEKVGIGAEVTNGGGANNSGKTSEISLFGHISPIPGLAFEKAPADTLGKKPVVSTLSTLILEKIGIKNPFLPYSSYCGKGEAKPVTLKIWLPFSENKKKADGSNCKT